MRGRKSITKTTAVKVGGLVTEEPEQVAALPVGDRGDIDAELEGEVEEGPVRGRQWLGPAGSRPPRRAPG